MKKTLLLSALASLLIFGNTCCYAQSVGVSGIGSLPDNSALLDVDATGMSPKKGLLIPRMTTTERDAISGPAESLMIFNTTTKCVEMYVNAGWYSLGCPAACTAPAAPTANAASSIGCTTLTANWSASSGATTYYLDISTVNTFASFVTGYNNLNVGNVTASSVTGLTANTTYYYRLRAATSCASVNSNTITAVTITIPTGVSASASPNPVCVGATLTLTGAATNATSWSWTGPSSFTSTAQSPTRASMVAGYAGVYSLTATNACGSATAANTASVTVNDVPTGVSASASPDPICVGATLTLTGAATNATSWSWTGPSSFSSASQSPTRASVTTAHAGVYSLTASNACGSATAANTASVTVNSPPAVTGQPSNVTIAAGANTSFSVTATGGGLTYQWQLSTNGGGTFNNQANGGVYSNMTTATMNITAATVGMTTYQYRCVVSGTCTPAATSNAAILTVSMQVAYTTPGTYTWTCPAGVTSVSVVCVGGGGGSLYYTSGADYWDKSGGGGGLGYKNNIAVTPGLNYTVVVGAGGGAMSGAASENGGDSYFINATTVKGGGGFSNTSGGAGGTHVGDGGGDGGNSGANSTANNLGGITGSGGGAGGYAGNGGLGATSCYCNGNAAPAGGGGGGGAFGWTAGGGGGVGILGQGSSGAGGVYNTACTGTPAGGGSGGAVGGTSGAPGYYCTGNSNGGDYGGGAGAENGSGHGGVGAVRIIWPGNTRSFPSTGTADQ